jgi:hypothetical protein
MFDREGHAAVHVPTIEDAERETKAALAHIDALIRVVKSRVGGEVATALDDAIGDLMAAFQTETMARLTAILQEMSGGPANVFVGPETPRRRSRLAS